MMTWSRTSLKVTALPPRGGGHPGVHVLPRILAKDERGYHGSQDHHASQGLQIALWGVTPCRSWYRKFSHSRWVSARRGSYPVSSRSPLRTGLATLMASGSAPLILLHGGTHEASVPISPVPQVSTRVQLARALGSFVSLFSKARGPSPSVLVLGYPAFLGSDYYAPSDNHIEGSSIERYSQVV